MSSFTDLFPQERSDAGNGPDVLLPETRRGITIAQDADVLKVAGGEQARMVLLTYLHH